MAIPESLAGKMALFRQQGYVVPYEKGLFLEPSWVAVYLGQRVMPQAYDIRADNFQIAELKKYFAEMKRNMHLAAQAMPLHAACLSRNLGKSDASGSMEKRQPPRASMNLYGRRSS